MKSGLCALAFACAMAAAPAFAQADLTAEVYGRADFLGGTNYAVGDDFLISFRVTNQGAGAAPGTLSANTGGWMVDIVLSTDAHVPAGFAVYSPNWSEDVLLRGGRMSRTNDLAPGQHQLFNGPNVMRGGPPPRPYDYLAFQMPAGVPAGNYHLCVVVDPANVIAESNEANNATCQPIVIGAPGPGPAPGQADLTAEVYGRSDFLGGTNYTLGDDILISFNVMNRPPATGTAPGTLSANANGWMVDIVLSTDTNVPAGFAAYSPNWSEDVLLRGGRMSSTNDLAPGQAQLFNGPTVMLGGPPPRPYDYLSFPMPTGLTAGNYYVCVVVDPANVIAETNELNNAACQPITIRNRRLLTPPVRPPVRPEIQPPRR